MNTKRQTIWLVSMLSLMVVLSAYYLFTEDVNNLDFSNKGAVPKEVTINAGELDSHIGTNTTGAAKTDAKTDAKADTSGKAQAPAADGKTTAPAAAGSDKTDPKASSTSTNATKNSTSTSSSSSTSTVASTDKNAASKTDAKSGTASADQTASASQSKTQTSSADAKVLEQMQTKATSGSDYFVGLQMKRDEDMSKQVENLMTVLADTTQTKEAAGKAQADLEKLEDMQTKMTNLEELLMKDFPQAVVTEDSGKYKVTVQSKKLEKSQALSIADQTMKELGIGPESIAIQYLP